MFIEAFAIQGFGRLLPQEVGGLSNGINIFYGPNEAGKSTSLEFFRSMLGGYPNRAPRYFAPLYGNEGGGRLNLQTSAFPQSVTLNRKAGKEKVLTWADGSELTPANHEKLFGGITRDLFRSIYAFSLTELESFDSISQDGVRHALYAASFGLGLRAPAEVLGQIDTQMGAYFKSSGQNPYLNKLIKQVAEVRKTITETEGDVAKFGRLSSALQEYKTDHQQTRERLQYVRQSAVQLASLLNVWPYWEEFLQVQAQLATYPARETEFPANGLLRMEQLLEKEQELTRKIHSNTQRLQQFTEEQSQLGDFSVFTQHEREILNLLERKVSYRNALNSLQEVQAEIIFKEKHIMASLTSLGASWDKERIMQFDRSLATHDSLAGLDGIVQDAINGYEREQADVVRKEEEYFAQKEAMEREEKTLEQARVNANLLPLLAASQSSVDALQELRSQAAFADVEYPKACRKVLEIEQHLKKSLQHISPQWVTDKEPAQLLQFDSSSSVVQQVVEFGKKQTELDAKTVAINAHKEALTGQVYQAKTQVTQLQEERAGVQTVNPELHTAQEDALNRLNKLEPQLLLAKEHYAEHLGVIEEHQKQAPVKKKRLISLILGVCLLLISAQSMLTAFGLNPLGQGDIVARAFFSPTTEKIILAFAQGSEFFEPAEGKSGTLAGISDAGVAVLSLVYLGFVVLLAIAAFALIIRGWPKIRKKERIHYQQEAEQLAAQGIVLLQQQEELQTTVEQILEKAELSDTAFADLEGAMWLHKEQARILQRIEQLEVKIKEHSQALELLEITLAERGANLASIQTEVADNKQQWQAWLQNQLLPATLSFTEGLTVFERVTHAHNVYGQLEASKEQRYVWERRVQKLFEETRQFCTLLPQLSGFTDVPQEEQQIQGLFRVVDTFVKQYAEVVQQQKEYERADAQYLVKKESFEKITSLYEHAQKSVERAEALYESAKNSRKEWLTEHGFDANLNPVVAREALNIVGQTVQMYEELEKHVQQEIVCQDEIDLVEEALKALLKNLQTEAPAMQYQKLFSLTDFGHVLEELAACLHDAKKKQAAHDSLTARSADLLNEQQEAESLLEKIQQDTALLFEEAQTEDVTAFRHLAHTAEEEKKLTLRQAELAASLGLGLSLSSVIHSAENVFPQASERFAHRSLEQLKNEKMLMDGEEQELARLESNQAESVATTSASLSGLAESNVLTSLHKKEQSLLADIRYYAREWSRFALAQQLLLRAKERFEKERQPEVVQRASDLFARISGGQWQGVVASLDKTEFKIVSSTQELLNIDILSRGACEQLYLALRLAYVEEHATHAEPLPLIFDDILVNFDPTRAERTASVLADISGDSKDEGHQMLYFTCHPHVVDMLRKQVPLAPLFTVDNGKILKSA